MNKLQIIKNIGLTLIVGIILLNRNVYAQQEGEVILFHSPNCGHCTTVDNYIEQNNIESKVNINYQDVTTDEAYNYYLEKSEAYCNMSSVSTPMLFVDNTCILGSTPVIDKLELLSSNTDGNVSGESSIDNSETDEDLNIDDKNTDDTADSNDNSEGAEKGDEVKVGDEIKNEADQEESQGAIEEVVNNDNTGDQPSEEVRSQSLNLTVVDIIFIIIAPISFLTIVYLLIKKLHL